MQTAVKRRPSTKRTLGKVPKVIFYRGFTVSDLAKVKSEALVGSFVKCLSKVIRTSAIRKKQPGSLLIKKVMIIIKLNK